MNEISRVFREQRKDGNGVLIGYVMGGDPDQESALGISEALLEGGVDILELGIPFSDPIADGPTIQVANVRALNAGIKPRTVLEIAGQIKRKRDVPVVLLTYYNPIFRMGIETFFSCARDSCVDGVVVPDLPIEEAADYRKTAVKFGVDTIFLAAPTTSSERLPKIVECSSGFLYLVSNYGVTGERQRLEDSTVALVKKVRKFTYNRVPLAVGFGLSKPEHAELVIRAGADGAIVGSAFVKIIEKNQNNHTKMIEELRELARHLKEAMTFRLN